MSVDSWVRSNRPRDEVRLRLFCLPYAGGGASVFRTWSSDLPRDINVCPVQLPGRESLLGSPPLDQMPLLVDALAREIRPYLDVPFALFGHSMGALVSFELARRLRNEIRQGPVRLFVSGHRAPQLPDRRAPIHDLPEDRFIDALARLNGTPGEVLRNVELRQMMIPVLRADFAVCETYQYLDEEPLDCPIEAFGGLEDDEVRQDEIGAWSEQTLNSFSLRMFPGDHFFVHSSRMQIIEAVAQGLRSMPPQRTEGAAHVSA
jgi:medium-chain acyl-[acyl-carrier-protein] hydrolase